MVNEPSVEAGRESEHHRRLLHQCEQVLSTISDGIALIGNDYRYRMANSSFLRQLGKVHDEVVGHPVAETLGRQFFEQEFKAPLDRCLGGETVHAELWHEWSVDNHETMMVSFTPYFELNDGGIGGAIISARGFSGARQGEEESAESQRWFRDVFDNVLDAILIADDEGGYTDANPAACTLFALSREQLLTMEVADFLEPGLDFSAIWQDFLKQGSMKGEIAMHFPDGRICQVEFAAKAHFLPHRHLSVLRDITDRKRLQEHLQQANDQLAYLANHDALTGLANRRYCDDHLAKEWQRMVREGGILALILCDVDYFKPLNDTYGHLVGDECLEKVGGAIGKAARRPADLVARYGGEEFLVVLPNTDRSGAVDVARAIQEEVQTLDIPNEGSVIGDRLTVSLGIACTYPDDTLSARQLVDRADQALYQAKQDGRDRYYCFG